MKGWFRRTALTATTLALTVFGLPQSAFADMGFPSGPGLFSGRSARYALFVVVAVALLVSASGVYGLWRMSVRSAIAEDAAPDLPGPSEAEGA